MSEDGRELRAGFTLPVRAGGDGPTRKRARGPGYRRTSQGFYVPSSVSTDDVDQRIVEASVVVTSHHAITGWAALRWQGGRWFDGLTASGEKLPVVICVGTGNTRRQPGIDVTGEGPSTEYARWVDGLRVMDPRLAVSFQMRYAPTDFRALVELEKAIDDDLVSIAEMEEFLTRQSGWTGIPRARRVMPRAQENSWSPQEVETREEWEVVAELPTPRCNAPVFDLTGRHVATPDLIDPVHGVYGEYDGEVHLDRATRDRDLRREAALRELGLEGVTRTAADRHDGSAFIARLRAAYARAERRPAADRRWTLDQPSWWTPTETVEQRRALTDE
ncbi:hypothetical protein, partial [Nocardioides sp.]|uniref:hypothetical protein n=1 Tax=Nocardioides sp. TaxID=35761 RepID=UPI00271C3AAE